MAVGVFDVGGAVADELVRRVAVGAWTKASGTQDAAAGVAGAAVVGAGSVCRGLVGSCLWSKVYWPVEWCTAAAITASVRVGAGGGGLNPVTTAAACCVSCGWLPSGAAPPPPPRGHHEGWEPSGVHNAPGVARQRRE